MDLALERAIPELILATHWYLRSFLPPEAPSSLLKRGTVDIKCTPTSLAGSTTSGEREITFPYPQLSFATTATLL